MSTCVISGTVQTPAGAAVEGSLVRARIVATPLVNGTAHVLSTPVVTWTDSSGAWSVMFPQGATVRIEIDRTGIDHYGAVPSSPTADFSALQPTWSRWIE